MQSGNEKYGFLKIPLDGESTQSKAIPDMLISTVQQEILKRSANVLRLVAENKSTSAMYFWHVTHALEAIRDGNPTEARISLHSAMDMEIAGDIDPKTSLRVESTRVREPRSVYTESRSVGTTDANTKPTDSH